MDQSVGAGNFAAIFPGSALFQLRAPVRQIFISFPLGRFRQLVDPQQKGATLQFGGVARLGGKHVLGESFAGFRFQPGRLRRGYPADQYK